MIPKSYRSRFRYILLRRKGDITLDEFKGLLEGAMGLLDRQFKVTLKAVDGEHVVVKCEREIYDRLRAYLTLLSTSKGRYMQIRSSGCVGRLVGRKA